MITGELKNRINSLWEIFWTGGITNPLDVVEQMTYLMFIRDLDDTDNLRAKESAMLASLVYISSAVIAVLPIDNLKLIMMVPWGTTLMPLQLTPASVMLSLVLAMYFLVFPISAMETHL